MEMINSFVVGIDLSSDYTQVSYLVNEKEEPRSMSFTDGEGDFLIPTLLGKRLESDVWYIGEEAERRAKIGDCICISKLLELVLLGKSTHIEKKEYFAISLLLEYIRELLRIIKKQCKIDQIDHMVITIEYPDRLLIDTIYKIINELNIPEKTVQVIGHSESFIYYTLNQKKELWLNEVALFDYNKNHFKYKRLSIARGKIPQLVSVEEADYSDVLSYELLSTIEGKQHADTLLLEFVQKEFHAHIVSAVYLTGSGFYEEWAQQSLPFICNKRRAFQGRNLFVKGACYAAVSKNNKQFYDDYLFQCAGRTKVSIGVVTQHAGRNMQLNLSEAGVNWYEAGAETEFILDHIDTIQLILTSSINKFSKNVNINLNQLPDRPRKTTRIKLIIAYKSEKQILIIVEDKGFGEFFPATDINIKKTINLDEFF